MTNAVPDPTPIVVEYDCAIGQQAERPATADEVALAAADQAAALALESLPAPPSIADQAAASVLAALAAADVLTPAQLKAAQGALSGQAAAV